MAKQADRVKTSIALPRKLWREAHIRALDEGLELQELIAKALAAYLKGGAR
jgi:hypothetical protein